MKKNIGILVAMIAVLGMFFTTGCTSSIGGGKSSCTVWYGKPGISVIGDQFEVGTVYVHQVTRRSETIGQVIVWEKCGTDGKFIGGKKTTTTGGFTFEHLKGKGYYIVTVVPGAGIAFCKCEGD